jgi:hypothetical protein
VNQTVGMSREMYNAISRMAETHGATLSSLIRYLLWTGLGDKSLEEPKLYEQTQTRTKKRKA